MPTAGDVFSEVRLLLNDTAAKLYTNTILLPVLNKAYRELQQNFIDNGIAVEKEQTAALTVPIGKTLIDFSTTPALPDNLLYPIMLYEKFLGQADTEYSKMIERGWPPDLTQSDRLMYWSWEHEALNFVGAIGPVELRIRFYGRLPVLTDAMDDLIILDCETFLAARTAAIAATVIGASPTKGQLLQGDAENALGLLLSTNVKNRQAIPVRRRPFRAFRFGGRLFWR